MSAPDPGSGLDLRALCCALRQHVPDVLTCEALPHVIDDAVRIVREAADTIERLAGAQLARDPRIAADVKRVSALCQERAETYGALRQTSLTARALDQAAALLRAQEHRLGAVLAQSTREEERA